MKLPFSEISDKPIVHMCIYKSELMIATESDVYKIGFDNKITKVEFIYSKPGPIEPPQKLTVPKETFSSDKPVSNDV